MAKKVLLRCRDAEMLGPFCDYVTEGETFDDVAREMRVYAKTHHERDITDEDLSELKTILIEKEGGINP
jgi:predicted small metal-binding protein